MMYGKRIEVTFKVGDSTFTGFARVPFWQWVRFKLTGRPLITVTGEGDLKEIRPEWKD